LRVGSRSTTAPASFMLLFTNLLEGKHSELWSGQELTPSRVNFYYRAGDKDLTSVEPFPAGLRMITGNVRWYCGTDDTTAGSKDPPKLCKSGMLGVRIVFPDCVAKGDLNDSNLSPVPSDSNYKAGAKIDPDTGQVIDPDSPDHRLHMARSVLQSDGTRSCPDTHPILFPTLTLNANFPIPKQSGRVTLSSGAVSTMHADFWNTWDQTELERLVVECINNGSPSDPHPEQCRSPKGTA
jgi:hypothetical protein